jgi:signal peptidase I
MRFLTYWYRGVSYTRIVAKSEGSILAIEKPQRFLLFNLWQRFQAGDQWYTVWFPPDLLLERAGLVSRNGQINPRVFKPGEEIMKIKLISGDHLFVDRVSYNFRRPRRGDIIVFQTAGIDYPGVPRDQYYIKRLVGLGGEKLKIGADNHLRVNDARLDTNTPGFERVYSLTNDYVGHTPIMRFAGEQEFPIRPDHYIVMGDNTANSLDSRFFGDFSREYVIGRAFCVYWPMGVQDRRDARFGWGIR